eukprot:scaffold425_cov373-Pinguiococcus_pyrenoidosus.AAC.4
MRRTPLRATNDSHRHLSGVLAVRIMKSKPRSTPLISSPDAAVFFKSVNRVPYCHPRIHCVRFSCSGTSTSWLIRVSHLSDHSRTKGREAWRLDPEITAQDGIDFFQRGRSIYTIHLVFSKLHPPAIPACLPLPFARSLDKEDVLLHAVLQNLKRFGEVGIVPGAGREKGISMLVGRRAS